jgi:primosomal protein N' (replication factor Y)
MLVEVAVPRPLWKTFTYELPDGWTRGRLPGCRVVVPFGREMLTGWIWAAPAPPPPGAVREVSARLDSSPSISPPVMELVRWAASYYCAPPGVTAAAALPLAPGMVRMAAVPPDSTPVPASDLPGGGPRSRLMSDLAELEESGEARSWLEPAPARRGPELLVRPLRPPEELAEEAGRSVRRAPARARVLAALASSSEGVPRRILARAAQARPDVIGRLIEAGFLEEVELPVPALPASMPALAGVRPPSLYPGQTEAVRRISGAGPGETILLHGITGSGKTEVYLRAIEEVIRRGRQALVLVPEISLTPQLAARFESRFPGRTALLHSAMRQSDRMTSWSLLSRGLRDVAIGARSAVFAQLPRPGLIIVDEEHDQGYKQCEQPRYCARDLAVVRGRIDGVPVVLGSATPSLESWGNASAGRYGLLELPARAGGRPLPEVERVSPPAAGGILSPGMVEELAGVRARSEQALVLLNRRGYSPSRICTACGARDTCPECGIAPTYHRRGALLRCHWCGWWRNAPPACPVCGGRSFTTEGPGIQKVEEELTAVLPGIRLIRMDRDTVSHPGAHWSLLERFASGGADILLGTQMIAKGHDFPGVTLVCILAADMALAFPDFRASERAFQLVLQAAGRAGRGDAPGRVLVQSADQVAFAPAIAQDYSMFLEAELPVRRMLGYPPYGHVARILWSGRDREAVRLEASRMRSFSSPGVTLHEPSPALMPRLGGRWRFSCLARSRSRTALREALERAPLRRGGSGDVSVDVDVDPVDLL